MAYDLVVGKSNKVKDAPAIVGSIEFEEYATICSLLKKTKIDLLVKISNLFEDSKFEIEELQRANLDLLTLLPKDLSVNERNLVHKLIAVVGYSLMAKEPLFGVSD